VATAREAGIGNVSLDLIFAVPEGLERDWRRDLDAALALAPEHLSLYGLTVEPHTPYARWRERGTAHEAPEDRYESEFLAAHASLASAGFEHYEVSNFARPGLRSRHNLAYWSGAPYLALGPSAHGFDGARRRWNVAPYAEWLRRLRAGLDPAEGEEALTDENRLAESVYLGLRTTRGAVLAISEEALVAPWIATGWARMDTERRLVLTPLGWLRLDALALALTAHRSR
jgi:oxygen-independent coproporphyrinogen-3 oxidase